MRALLFILVCLSLSGFVEASSLAELEAIVSRAPSFDAFLKNEKLQKEYERALVNYQHRDHFRCESFKTILGRVQAMTEKLPALKATLWKSRRANHFIFFVDSAGKSARKINLYHFRAAPRAFHALFLDPSRQCDQDVCSGLNLSAPNRWLNLISGSEAYFVEKDGVFTSLSLHLIPTSSGKEKFGAVVVAGGPGLFKSTTIYGENGALTPTSLMKAALAEHERIVRPEWVDYVLFDSKAHEQGDLASVKKPDRRRKILWALDETDKSADRIVKSLSQNCTGLAMGASITSSAAETTLAQNSAALILPREFSVNLDLSNPAAVASEIANNPKLANSINPTYLTPSQQTALQNSIQVVQKENSNLDLARALKALSDRIPASAPQARSETASSRPQGSTLRSMTEPRAGQSMPNQRDFSLNAPPSNSFRLPNRDYVDSRADRTGSAPPLVNLSDFRLKPKESPQPSPMIMAGSGRPTGNPGFLGSPGSSSGWSGGGGGGGGGQGNFDNNRTADAVKKILDPKTSVKDLEAERDYFRDLKNDPQQVAFVEKHVSENEVKCETEKAFNEFFLPSLMATAHAGTNHSDAQSSQTRYEHKDTCEAQRFLTYGQGGALLPNKVYRLKVRYENGTWIQAQAGEAGDCTWVRTNDKGKVDGQLELLSAVSGEMLGDKKNPNAVYVLFPNLTARSCCDLGTVEGDRFRFRVFCTEGDKPPEVRLTEFRKDATKAGTCDKDATVASAKPAADNKTVEAKAASQDVKAVEPDTFGGESQELVAQLLPERSHEVSVNGPILTDPRTGVQELPRLMAPANAPQEPQEVKPAEARPVAPPKRPFLTRPFDFDWPMCLEVLGTEQMSKKGVGPDKVDYLKCFSGVRVDPKLEIEAKRALCNGFEETCAICREGFISYRHLLKPECRDLKVELSPLEKLWGESETHKRCVEQMKIALKQNPECRRRLTEDGLYYPPLPQYGKPGPDGTIIPLPD